MGAFKSWFARTRICLRLARREITRHRGRSALIVCMVMMPVALVMAVAVVSASMVPNAQERVSEFVGGYQAKITEIGQPILQDPRRPDEYFLLSPAVPGAIQENQRPESSANKLLPDLLPANSELLPTWQTGVSVSTSTYSFDANLIYRDIFRPEERGGFTVIDGGAPQGDTGVAVTEQLAKNFELKVGDSLEIPVAPNGVTLTVSSVVRPENRETPSGAIYFFGKTFAGASLESLRGSSPVQTWYVASDSAVGWNDVQKLNKAGFLVDSRTVLLDPPPGNVNIPDGLQSVQRSESGENLFVGLGVIGGGVLALIFAMVCVSAYSVSARQQYRSSILLAITGADRRTVSGTLTSMGLILGAVGGIVGVAVGIGAGVGAVAIGKNVIGGLYGPHIWWAIIPILILAAIAVSMISSGIPARRLKKSSMRAALRLARTAGDTKPPRWRAGIVTVTCGLAVSLAGYFAFKAAFESESQNSTQFLGSALAMVGLVVVLIGILLLVSPIVALLAKNQGKLPVSLRMALRDSARNRTRTTASVGVIAVVTMGVSLGMISSASAENYILSSQPRTTAENTLALTVNSQARPKGVDPMDWYAQLDSAVLETQPSANTALMINAVESMANCTATEEKPDCDPYLALTPEANRCTPDQNGTLQCEGGFAQGRMPSYVEGDAATFQRITGVAPSPQEQQALDSGGALTFVPALIDGQVLKFVQLDDESPRDTNARYLEDYYASSPVGEVPATVSDKASYGTQVLLSPSAAERLGMTAVPILRTYDIPQPLGAQKVAQLAKTVSELSVPGRPVQVLDASEGQSQAEGISTVIAAGALGFLVIVLLISAGLAAAEGREANAVLASIGASPRVRKALAGWQSGTTGMLGCALGGLIGVIFGMTFTQVMSGASLSVPWLGLAVLLLGTPLAAAAVAWLFTRAKLPPPRRERLG